MIKVNAELEYGVWVKCPNCNEDINLVDQDVDHLLAACVFGDADGRANWQNTGLEFECTSCDEHFELDNIEY